MAFAAEPDSIGSTQRLLELWSRPSPTGARSTSSSPTGPCVARRRPPPRSGDAPRWSTSCGGAGARPPRRAPTWPRSWTPGGRPSTTGPTEELADLAPTPRCSRIWARLGFASGVLLPLVAGDRAVGVLALMSGRPRPASRRPSSPPSRALAAECALPSPRRPGWPRGPRPGRASGSGSGPSSTPSSPAPVATVVVDTDLRVLHHNEALRARRSTTRAPTPGVGRPLARSSPWTSCVPSLAGELVRAGPAGPRRRPRSSRPTLRTERPGRRRYWQVSAFPIRPGRRRPLRRRADLRRGHRRAARLAAPARRPRPPGPVLDAGGMGTWDWDLVTGQVLWSPRHGGHRRPGAEGPSGTGRGRDRRAWPRSTARRATDRADHRRPRTAPSTPTSSASSGPTATCAGSRAGAGWWRPATACRCG